MAAASTQSSRISSSGLYFPFLDGIRGFAVLSVVLFHTLYFNPDSPLQHALLSLSQAGWLGVPIFFVLSGFLISFGIFTASAPFDYYAYFIRRTSKIIPPFYLSLLIFGALSYYRKGGDNLPLCLFYNATTSTHFLEGWNYIDSVYWSLFIEIHFYIALPVIYLFCRKFFKNADWLTCGLFFITPALIRLLTQPPTTVDPDHWYFIYNLFPRALDYFAWGILFSIVFLRWHDSETVKKIGPAFGFIGLCLMAATYLLYAILQYHFSIFSHPSLSISELFRYMPSIATFFLLFLCFSPEHRLTRILSFGPLVYMGIVSYEWFLFHMPPVEFIQVIVPSAHGNTWIYLLRTAGPTIGTFILAALIYHLFSVPILDAAKRHLKERKSAKTGSG